MNKAYRIYYKKKNGEECFKSFWDKDDLFKQVSENFFDSNIIETTGIYHIRHVKNIAHNIITMKAISLAVLNNKNAIQEQ